MNQRLIDRSNGHAKVEDWCEPWPLAERKREGQNSCGHNRQNRHHHAGENEFPPLFQCLVPSFAKPRPPKQPGYEYSLNESVINNQTNKFVEDSGPLGKLIEEMENAGVK